MCKIKLDVHVREIIIYEYNQDQKSLKKKCL